MTRAGRLELQAEQRAQFSAAKRCDVQGAAVEFSSNPLSPQCEIQERRSQRAAEMRAPFTPVEAGAREATPEGSGGGEVDTEGLESFFAMGRERISLVLLSGTDGEPAQGFEAVMERNAHHASDVIVASARFAKIVRSAGHKLFARAGENVQAF